jgi:NAD(P)-dependent dehydrogenase (short-subunit alcohol dehydrogenase family)
MDKDANLNAMCKMVPAVVKKPALSLRPDATYLLVGGLGGLGRSLATRIAARGARYIVFTSRSVAQKPEAQELLAKLGEQGVNTKAFACDIGDEAEFRRVLSEIEVLGFPKVAGTVTFAMQIHDVFFENMTASDFQAAVRPKVNVTRNMHRLLPKDLDFFICMSSVAGIVGSRGQGNYNAG